MAIKALRGFKDILPGESEKYRFMEEQARQVFKNFGFNEIRLPLLEKTELFARGIGDHTDIVEKEMYTFKDRRGDSVTLRPEATAGIMRAVLEHKLYSQGRDLKLFTIGPMFRYERPQKGRLRQFNQINSELIGSQSPLADAEIIGMAWDILTRCTSAELRVEINSLGCPDCRPLHREALNLFLENQAKELCEDCIRRSKTNPLRIFDCKQEKCRSILKLAPLIKHYWCPECSKHLGEVLDFLEIFEIPFVINPYLVRGLDYYVRTTFEIIAQGLGAQNTVAAGGRYDGLSKVLGGPDLPGVGMAVGMERLLLLLDKDDYSDRLQLFIAALGREAREEAVEWLKEFRDNNISVQISYEDKSLKAQLKQADRLKARYVLIVGEKELEEEEAILKNMETSQQQAISLDEVTASVIKAICSETEETQE